MPHLTGARELGLDVHWEFGFVENGTRAATTTGVVYLDVGGYAAPGILDHHAAAGNGSTASVLLDRPDLAYNHLLDPWLKQRDLGQAIAGVRWTPRLVTHYEPDWDGIVTVKNPSHWRPPIPPASNATSRGAGANAGARISSVA